VDKTSLEEEVLEKSIAVLPFDDMTPQGDLEYLGDGLAEEIINSLTTIRELKVIGRTSSFQFKGEHLDLRAIGEKLGVDIILEGSIQKYEDHFRITAQLVRAKDNFHIWSERFDLVQTNIFKIQDSIASNIVAKLQLTLSSLEKKRIIKKEIDPEAYNLFLKGMYQYKAEKYTDALYYMKKVIDLDSTYAPAFAYLGLSKSWVTSRAKAWHDTLAVNEALSYSQRSIELDPGLAEGYSSIALISWSLQNDFAKARTYFEKSIELNPAASLILNRYCYFLVWMENFDKATQLAREAMRVDPVDYNSYMILYLVSIYSGQLDTAAGYLKERKRIFGNIVELPPEVVAFRRVLSKVIVNVTH
jgi:TolB-like protein